LLKKKEEEETMSLAKPQQPLQTFRGTVKQVTSGDCIVLKSLVVKDGKNLEKTCMLSNISAPRLGRNTRDNQVESDMPYAFEAREFLRKKLMGKEVCFVKETSTQNNVDRGTLYLGKDNTGENINDALVSAGLVEVRRSNKGGEEESRLIALEEEAKSHSLGKWSKTEPESDHVRDVKYTLDNPTHFVDSFKQKAQEAIIEYVRDGSTLRVLLLPSYHNVTVQLSGIKCPSFKRETDGSETAEPFADEAKSFVETRLLHRDVKVVLEGVANAANGILLGTVHHPNGNMSELLLREGLARCVDWSMGRVTGGAEKYRAAEKEAKSGLAKIWTNYTPSAIMATDAKTFAGKVVEVLNGDGMVVKQSDGSFKKIYLSSIRPPRAADFPTLAERKDKKNVALYDVPYLFEAREFLRKKLIGKKVNCLCDYVQPTQDNYPEKVCCSVMLGETNVAEALVTAGLAKVIRYKQDNDQRSSHYDELLSAESRAEKKGCGIHSTKDLPLLKIADINGDPNKAKQFLPFLQRAGKIDALVEFVSSGSRFKLYLPKETCLCTFLLSGIDCPRLGRPAMGNTPAQASDEFAEEAFLFSKAHCLQHEVKIEVEGIDKGGNFIGQLVTDDGINLSVGLVEAGLASVSRYTPSNQGFLNQLNAAEHNAKQKKTNKWKNYVEEKVVTEEEALKSEPQERTVNQKKIVITEVTSDLHFYGQLIENGPKLEQLSNQLRSELDARPPVPGAYTPKKNDLCVAKFSVDNEWYRAKVQSVSSTTATNIATVLFIDYGNSEQIPASKLAQMPAGFESLPAQAGEYQLALVQTGPDEDDLEASCDRFKRMVFADGEQAEFTINTEYKLGSVEFVTLSDLNKNDLGKKLVQDGYVSVDRARREKRLQKMLTDYLKSLSNAKQAHKVMWRYGDKEQDDAAEFGISVRK
jgi:staphylococcal nuclease domain-containing protein 1